MTLRLPLLLSSLAASCLALGGAARAAEPAPPADPPASTPPADETPSAKVERLYHDAMEGMATKDFLRAAALFDEAAALADDPILIWNAGRAYHQGGELAKAKERYERCLTRPDFPAEKRDLIAKYLIEIDRAGRPPEQLPPPAPRPLGPGPWILGASGIAVAATGVILHLVAEGQRDDVRGALDGSTDMTQRAAKDTEASANGLDTAGAVMLGVGAAAVVGGVIWIVAHGSAAPETRGTVHVSGQPLPGGGLAALDLRF